MSWITVTKGTKDKFGCAQRPSTDCRRKVFLKSPFAVWMVAVMK